MDLTVRILCRPEIAPGFELAGVRADTASNVATTRARLAELTADPEVGIVLIEDDLHRALPTEAVERLERLRRPLVAPFPGPRLRPAGSAEEIVLELLRRAIGYRVRLP